MAMWAFFVTVVQQFCFGCGTDFPIRDGAIWYPSAAYNAGRRGWIDLIH